nr:putative reverse transcriptase domain-containing protein [Tanacetum cinerariifolium]
MKAEIAMYVGKRLDGETDETALEGSNLDTWSAGFDHLRSRRQVHVSVLAVSPKSLRHTIGYEYIIPSTNRWPKLKWETLLVQKFFARPQKRSFKSSIVYKLHVIDRRATPTRDVRTVAYRLELPEKLSRVHSTFHVSNLKKCLSDEPLTILLDEIHVDDKLIFIEKPIEVMDREVKVMKQSRIPIVKVYWNSRRGPEYTWERKDQMQKKYPHLFTNPESASQATS